MTIVNRILRADSYKLSQFLQLPPGTTEMSAYVEARAGARFPEITFFGLQILLKQHWGWPVTQTDLREAERFQALHMPGVPFNREGWEIIVNDHGGRLPVEIQAIPEGMTVPVGTPLVQVRNTDPRLPWLTTFIETELLRAIWYPSTVATLSREAKKVIYAGLLRSSDDPDGQLPFKLHDFGARGCTSAEQAEIGGAAHLINFMGSDTVEGIVTARECYRCEMPAFSIAAAEHSTITAWGSGGEAAAFRNMLEQFNHGLVAAPGDSYDLDNAVREIWGKELRTEVLTRDGTVVVRPDSGHPIDTPVRTLRMLEAGFGSDRNSKSYRVLPKQVRAIQGDGMNLDTLAALVRAVLDAGFSLDNIAFGMGGGLLQKVDRDTMRFAMKANEAVIAGERRDVFKQPATDRSKASKAGRQAVWRRSIDGSVFTLREGEVPKTPAEPLMKTVWRNGELLVDWTFDQVRANAALPRPLSARAA